MTRALNLVPFVSVANMMRLVNAIGVERFLTELAGFVEEDFRRWAAFDKISRLASHSAEGVIELMPTSDGVTYGFKYVNGHPKNMREGRQTVTAFGLLAEVSTGYPVLLSEMTILTALRTAATSAVAAKHLARPGSRSMAITSPASPTPAARARAWPPPPSVPSTNTAPGRGCNHSTTWSNNTGT